MRRYDRSYRHSQATRTRRPTRLTDDDYELLADFRYALRRFLQFSEEAAFKSGLSPQQHQALLAVHGFSSKHPVSVGTLAERMGLRHHSAVELVDRLESLRLIRRSRNPADKRQVFLTVTPQGKKVISRLSAVHREEIARIGPHLEHLLERLSAHSRKRRRARKSEHR